MKQATKLSYEARMSRVIAYLYDHLDEDIDLDRLAQVACLSPYHWHRIYQAVSGETIAATVKRLRLHRAAGLLAHTAMPVGAVAAGCGYANVQSFTRIFAAAYGMPPAQYRREGHHTAFASPYKQGDRVMFDVAIGTIDAMNGVGVDHTGAYMDIGKAFETLFATLATRALMTGDMQMVGIYFDDPSRTPEPDLRSRACVMSAGKIEAAAPLRATSLAGGTHALLRYKGPYAGIRDAYDWLFGVWLPQSGRDAADAPVFELYRNNPRDTAPADLLTDICVPLKD